jgi:hypothetical protein
MSRPGTYRIGAPRPHRLIVGHGQAAQSRASRVIRSRPFVVIAATLAVCAAAAGVATAASSVSFTIGNTGAECSLTAQAVSCQTSNSARTLSATLSPDGTVTMCSQPQGASPGCILWPGVVLQQFSIPEPQVGPFECIPIAHLLFTKPVGVVCSVVSTGKGFRITAGKISRVSTISKGPHPPCTRAALTAALERAYHKRSLAPSHLAGGWQCAGSFARGDFIDLSGPADVTVVFRAARRTWRLAGRGKICEDGEIPARIWYFACAVN